MVALLLAVKLSPGGLLCAQQLAASTSEPASAGKCTCAVMLLVVLLVLLLPAGEGGFASVGHMC